MTGARTDDAPVVVYARKDYAGTGRRILILAIDGLIVYAVYVLLMTAGCAGLLGEAGPYLCVLGIAGFCFGYFAVLARTAFGTLGYALTSVRVVDITGARPSLACMTYRTTFAVLGPLNILLDLLWVGSDPNRQAIRDKLPGTYVVRKGAVPAGTGRQWHVMLWFLGYSFMVREVSTSDA